jgi:DNA-binding transcriptional ArsR family regulator
LRLRLLALLREGGPSTATRLAERLGLSSGATSYHLRQLAAHGFVVEDETRGNARERWWRALHRGTYFDDAESAPDDPELSQAYLRAVATQYADAMLRSVEEQVDLPPEWQPVGTLSDFRFRLTPDEATQMLQDLLAVLGRYRDYDAADAPAEAELFALQLQAFPLIDASTERSR